MKTFCTALALVAGGWVSAAQGQVNIAVDIDSMQVTGAGATGPIATHSGFTSWDLTNVQTEGSTITVDDVTFEIFGLAGADQSRVRLADDNPDGGGGPFNDLLADFVFNEGNTGDAIGLRISGLPVGVYNAQSWHADYGIGQENEAVRIEVRNEGEPADPSQFVVDQFFFSPDPAAFLVEVTEADQVKEIIFRQNAAEPSTSTRARLNGFTIQTIPEPSTLALAVVAGGIVVWLRRRWA